MLILVGIFLVVFPAMGLALALLVRHFKGNPEESKPIRL